MSSESAPSRTGSLHTNRSPTPRLRPAAGSWSRRTSRRCRTRQIATAPAITSTVTTAYDNVVPPTANSTPPTAGPATEASCQVPLRHVMALR